MSYGRNDLGYLINQEAVMEGLKLFLMGANLALIVYGMWELWKLEKILRKMKEGVERMADITMCTNDQCPLKGWCYRQTAIPNEYRQSMAHFEYHYDDEGKVVCEHYWPGRLKDELEVLGIR